MTVTQAEFSRMAGTSKAAICTKVKNKTLILDSGGMLDTDNPVNRKYLEKHQAKRQRDAAANALFAMGGFTGVSGSADMSGMLNPNFLTGAAPAPEKPKTQNTAKELLNMTLGQIINNYTNLEGLERYVKIRKDLITIDEKQQRLEERRLLQVPKDFVVSRLFSFINQLTNKILDVPESLADQVIALVKSDSDNCRQKIINYSRDILSRAIGGAKDVVINELASLKAKYDDSEDVIDKLEEIQENIHS